MGPGINTKPAEIAVSLFHFPAKYGILNFVTNFTRRGFEAVGNVTLIGMPGSGKSTVGVLLAKALGYGFLDTDLVIQQQEGALLQEILDEKGVPYFLDAEERAVCSVQCDQHVIAPGGSVVCRVPLEELKVRIHNLDSRGIALEPGQTLEDILTIRAPLYERYADAVVDATAGQLTAQTVSLVLERLEQLVPGLTKHAPSPQGTVGRPQEEQSLSAE